MIRIGVSKGKLYNTFVNYFNIKEELSVNKINKVLIRGKQTEVVFLRYEDLKRNLGMFDYIFIGNDQLIENMIDDLVILESVPQKNNVRISLCTKGKKEYSNIITSYPNLLKMYKNDYKNLKYLSGNIELGIDLGMGDSIVDIVESGRTLKENNLVEIEQLCELTGLLCTKKKKLVDDAEGLRIAFEGIDGTGKTSLSKLFFTTDLNQPKQLIHPYSDDIGKKAFVHWENKQLETWKNILIPQLNRKQKGTVIYDRHIITLLTDFIIKEYSDDYLLKIVREVHLPDVLVYCYTERETLIQRNKTKKDYGDFDTEESNKKYLEAYEYAKELLKKNTTMKIIEVDTTINTANITLEKIKEEI